MLITKYKLSILQIIVYAISYEVYSYNLCDDITYDILAKEIEDEIRRCITTYSSDSGIWVNSILNDDFIYLTEVCRDYHNMYLNVTDNLSHYEIDMINKVLGVTE